MGKIATFSTPPLFQSKLLCFSLVFLFLSLLLAARFTFSATKCIFRSSPFDPLQGPLFFYPSSYAQHKHAIPTTRSSCKSPILFSDYWQVLDEIRTISARLPSSSLRFLQRNAHTFGGNLSFHERFSYLKHGDHGFGIPCGFFKHFPVSSLDRGAMEKCKGVVVVSAIFNDHDKIRQPMGLGSKTLDLVCFFMFVDDATLNRLHSHNLITRQKSSKKLKIGAWTIVKVWSEQLYENPAMNGVIAKYLVHRLFPNSKYSIWVDAKLQLVVDPLLLIHSLVIKESVDMAVSKHPFFLHTVEEAAATARWRKWSDVNGIKIQMETYCEHGLQPWNSDKPYPSDVPDSGLILRKHSVPTNLFSCLIFNELEGFNPRDQLPFAFVRDKMRPKLRLNMFEVEVFEQVAIEYRHNTKIKQGGGPGHRGATSALFANGTSGKCDGYLLHMWGEVESHD